MDRAASFAELAARLQQESSVRETVDQIVRFAVQAVGCSDAGLALAERRGCLGLGAATSTVAAELYGRQIEGCPGPLVAAFGTNEAVVVADTAAAEERWPEWARHAFRLGVRSVVDVPLPADRPLGVLSLYSIKPNAFNDDDIAVGHILAQHAAVAVINATKESNLRAAIDSRKLIGRAQGILMERYSLDADQAFAVLRRYSQDYNVKLREVAEQLINSRELPQPTTQPTRHAGTKTGQGR